jgi:hypothetical protein
MCVPIFPIDPVASQIHYLRVQNSRRNILPLLRIFDTYTYTRFLKIEFAPSICIYREH